MVVVSSPRAGSQQQLSSRKGLAMSLGVTIKILVVLCWIRLQFFGEVLPTAMPEYSILLQWTDLAILYQNPPLALFEKLPKNLLTAMDLIVKQRDFAGQRATFIQIGANDGIMYDPLYKHMISNQSQWIGLQVEPQTELFQNLPIIHHNAEDWAFYNGVIAGPNRCVNRTIEFCETKTPGVGSWDTQGQLNTITLAACGGNNPKMHIVKRPCLPSFENLVMEQASPEFKRRTTKCLAKDPSETSTSDKKIEEKQCTFHVDLVQIDVEGYDFDVIQLIDFDHMIPQCIHYESFHLKGKEQAALDFLRAKGYTVRERIAGQEMDTLACRTLNKQV
eukprot:CAMPEP_0198284404 /NCGR_PEP_ID=MMETSP1449-20131203/3876_1 /TAXON_ID=420275 /ORGANISM="Attheya septentrionalis, Strain CCMP2084" /LENGTH=332 /DNA_ID=CAMNT_0043981449 /DNA_START=25 /DNA_END=1023 /DNA_ORIENTATION=-